jgi:penicillin-binding protein 1A
LKDPKRKENFSSTNHYHQQRKMPAEHVRSASPTLEELEERMKAKREKLAREAEEKRKAEEERKRAEEEAAKKAAEEAKAAKAVKTTAAKKRKPADVEEVVAGPSKKLKARAITADPEPDLAESPCQR